MPIAIQCADCSSTYNVDDRLAGKRVKCKNCGSAIFVPRLGGAASAPASAVESTDVDYDALVAAAAQSSQVGYTPAAAAPAYAPPPTYSPPPAYMNPMPAAAAAPA